MKLACFVDKFNICCMPPLLIFSYLLECKNQNGDRNWCQIRLTYEYWVQFIRGLCQKMSLWECFVYFCREGDNFGILSYKYRFSTQVPVILANEIRQRTYYAYTALYKYFQSMVSKQALFKRILNNCPSFSHDIGCNIEI